MNKPVLHNALKCAIKAELLYQVSDNRYARPKDLLGLSNNILKLDEGGKAFSMVEFKKAIGCGRNLAIELLEYFDKIRFTQRRDNERVVVNPQIAKKLFEG